MTSPLTPDGAPSRAALRLDAFDALRDVFKALNDGVVVADTEGRLLFVNDAAARMMGYPSAEATADVRSDALLDAVQLFDVNGNPLPMEQLTSRRAFLGEQPPPCELRFRSRETGEERWTELTSTPLFAPNGKVEQVITIFRDVTPRRQAARASLFLAAASATLSASLDYAVTLRALVHLAVPELADLCSVSLAEEDGTTVHELAHVDPAKEWIVRELALHYGFGTRIASWVGAMKTGKPMHLPHLPEDRVLAAAAGNPEQAALLRALGLKSVFGVPLTARGRVLGTFTLVMTEGNRGFSEERRALAVELAGRAALAVDNARLYRDAQAAFRRKDEEARINDALQRLGTSFASELDPDKLLQLIIDEATGLTGARFGVFFRQEARAWGAARATFAATLPAEAQGLLPLSWLDGLFQPGAGLAGPLRREDVTTGADVAGVPLPAAALEPPLSTRSLLAVPVRSRSGEVLGGLVLGHTQRGAFTAQHEGAVASIAAQAAVALDNARFFHELRAAQEQLRAGEERLRLALAAGRMGYYDLDLATFDGDFSPRLVEMCGYPPETPDFTVEHFMRAVHPEDSEWVARRLHELLAARTDNDAFELRLLWPDGSVHWVERYIKVVQDANGRPSRLLGTMLDVTERHLAQDKLERLLKELVRSNTELEQFAYIASHDLQAPLRMVASYTKLLARRYQGKLDSDADDFIRFVVDGVDRMNQLIHDLLTYSRAGSTTKPLEPVSCQEVFDRTVDVLGTALEESGGQLTADPLPEVMGDDVQLGQLFQNLIGNALKFRGEAPPRVHVGVERRDGEWLFSVKDNGIGIEPQNLQRVFVIFQRVHGSERYPGTGLGLAICKKIVERHGGRLWVESQPGQGSTFFFTVPARARAAQPAA